MCRAFAGYARASGQIADKAFDLISPLHSAKTLSSSLNTVSWCAFGRIVILLQALMILGNLIIKCKMLRDCKTFTDAYGSAIP